MKAVKLSIMAAALTVALSASAFAQATTQPPRPATPATQPPLATTPKPAPEPPAPFPQDAKIAFVNVQEVANQSQAGKDASAQLKSLQDKKMADLQAKNKQLQDMTAKSDQGGAVLSDTARAQLEKDIENLQRQIQFDQQTAQSDMQDQVNQLQGDFQKKLVPIIEQIGKEKGLHAVFSQGDAGAIYIHPGLDITQEVIKRLDASAGPKKN
jgi:outer membrane protein